MGVVIGVVSAVAASVVAVGVVIGAVAAVAASMVAVAAAAAAAKALEGRLEVALAEEPQVGPSRQRESQC